MADRLTLEAETRIIGQDKAKHLRNEGLIPAVLYGQSDNIHLKIDNLTLRRILKEAGTTNLIDIKFNGSKRTVVVKEVQAHTTRGELIHVDFYEVDMKEKIVVSAELFSTGMAVPEADGLGTAALVLHSVEIECMPDNLISQIEVDLGQIENPEDMIYVNDLPIPDGVDVLTDHEAVVARFEYTPIEPEEEEEVEEDLMFDTAADEVEVIGKGKREEEEEEEFE